MGLATIRVADKVKQCFFYEDGFVIYQAMRKELDKGNRVAISFDTVRSVPSGFINGCFNELLKEIGVEGLKQNVQVINSTNLINDMIRRRVRIEIERNKEAAA